MSDSPRRRSRPYPAFDLERSYDDLIAVSVEGSGDSDVLAKALGYASGKGGASIRRIAAMVHYGFMERDGNEYVLTDFGQQLVDLNPEDGGHDEELRGLMVEALGRPEVFAEALDPYKEGELERDGLAKFFQEAGITRKASGRVADIFLRSCEFAGVKPPPAPALREGGPAEPGQAEVGGWLAQGRTLDLGPRARKARLSLALVLPEDLDSTEREILAKRLEFEFNLEFEKAFGYRIRLTDLLEEDENRSGEVADLKEFRARKENG